MLSLALAAPAQEDRPAVSPATYDALAAARSLMDKGGHAGAAARLNALLAKVDHSAYEAALTRQLLGHIYAAMRDYAKAAALFRQALERNALPAADARSTTYNLAQILIHDGQYQEGLALLESWLKEEGAPSRDARALAAVGYYQSRNCRSAIPHLRILAGEADNGEQQWSQALLGCYIDAKQYGEASALLEDLLLRDPANNENWLQLAAAYQQSERVDRAIAVLELMRERNVLEADALANLARLHVSRGTPYQAASLLEAGIADGTLPRSRDNLQLLADSLLLAQESAKAIAALSEIINIAPDGEVYFRMGRIQFDLQRWPEAIRAMQKAIEAGDAEDLATAHLLLGIAAVHDGKGAVAERSLKVALRNERTHDQADWWLHRLQTRAAGSSGSPDSPGPPPG